jgi:hypothetical protein
MALFDRLSSALFEAILSNQKEIEEPSPDSFWHAVKVIHADELQTWGSFKEYRDHNSMSYAEYWGGVNRIEGLKKRVAETLRAQDRLEELEKETLEEFDRVEVEVPPSWLGKQLKIPLPAPPYAKTEMTCNIGEITEGNLYVKGKWKKRKAVIVRSCPSNVLHKEELKSIRQRLKDLPPEEVNAVHEARTSRFNDPVLFVSHRWESLSHPDPDNAQYRKLAKLRGCFLIYDYSSFPQNATDETEKAALKQILANMNRLIKNVVVLESPSYMQRGWCLYEYILASLTLSTVCDEIKDPDFVKLRNFRATRPTIPENLIRGHSIDSSIQNGIAAEILNTVNRILPKFGRSFFSVQQDREIVTELLLDKLLAVLPQKKEYPSPYLGEWVDAPWTREELRGAFQTELQWKELYTAFKLNPYRLKVPDTLEAALANKFALDKAPPNTSMTWLERIAGTPD